MQISVIVNLSREPYRLKTFGLLCKSLAAQTSQDFELVVINHDYTEQPKAIIDVIQESFDISRAQVHWLQRQEGIGYDINSARNQGHMFANGTWHLVLDCDLILPPNFIETVLNHLSEERLPGHVLDVFTWPHCSTIGYSNDQRLHCVTEADLEHLNLDTTFQDADRFIREAQRLTPGSPHRRLDKFQRLPGIAKLKCGSIAYFWNHPVVRIEYNYRPQEFFFIAHRDWFRAVSYWPVHPKLVQRGPDKIILADTIYNLHDQRVCTLHTITDTHIVHLEHPRPYVMDDNPGAWSAHKYFINQTRLKLITNRLNIEWIQRRKKFEEKSPG
jgi:glycosyltransferase involved in cell wall biosynthesis